MYLILNTLLIHLMKRDILFQNRMNQLLEKGEKANFSQILREIQQRDYQDTHREIAPLKMARDSVKVDTSELDIEGVVAQIRQIVLEKVTL